MTSVLDNPTLVLNKGWQAIRIESVRDSIVKAFTGSAKFIDHNDYQCYTWDEWADVFCFARDDDQGFPCVVTPKFMIRAPEVVVLTNYDKLPDQDVRLTRRNVFIRDGFRCQYTGKKLTSRTGTLDHVVPRSQGGKTTWDNIVLASFDANVKKGGRTPEEAGMKLNRKPEKPRWHPIYTRWLASLPESWKKFIKTDKWNEIGYWDVELVD